MSLSPYRSGKQEPALLVIGLDNFPDELLGQLLEWSPTVIATPETAEKLAAYGIKIDWVIADCTGEVFQSDIKLLSPGTVALSTPPLNTFQIVNLPQLISSQMKYR